mgnify:FL=1
MLKIEKIPESALRELLEEERNGADDKAFVSRYVANVVKTLLSDPLKYRCYGAYWWPMKRLIAEHQTAESVNYFGDEYDTALNDMLSYDNDALTVCACYLELEANVEEGLMSATEFFYETDDGEGIKVALEDPAMEKAAYLQTAI